MNIRSAKYVYDTMREKNCSILVEIQIADGRTATINAPMPPDYLKDEEKEAFKTNRHYRAVLDWVAAGNTIADAD